MYRTILIFIVSLFFPGTFCLAQETILYKTVDTTRLFIEVYYPPHSDISQKSSALVFFFGGGWKNGNRTHFLHHARYFSKRGLVCFLVDYRTESQHKTTPFESLKDAKSAMRFIRKNAHEFKIDADKIIASGGSAGGHLAAATAFTEKYNETTDDTSVSCIPNALVLFNPVIDNGPGGFGYERVGEEYKEFSPLHNIKSGAPPTILFLGTKDKIIPVETADYFKMVMNRVGNTCELKLYENEQHSFFNYSHRENYKNTVKQADEFLQSLGYLKKEPFVQIE